MKRYRNETEKAVAMATAQAKIQEFLKHYYSYTELMVMAAKAQAQVFNIMQFVEPNKTDQFDVAHIAEFFHFALKAFELLEPFNENEVGAV